MIEEQPTHTVESTAVFPMVALCASAGGLAAYTAFFSALPADSGMAFLVVQHLLPSHESILPKLIQKHSPIPVQLMADNASVLPNHVYVLPPGAEAMLWNQQIQLAALSQSPGQRSTIDHFLQSLARDQGERVAAIILSGASSDGTEGARAVKQYGGLVIAQEPGSASYPYMPASAIDADLADVVLVPAKIPDYLMQHFAFAPPRLWTSAVQEDTLSEADVNRIIQWLREHTGRDFLDYKFSTLRRQIARRIILHHLGDVDAYLGYLEQYPDEANRLMQSLLINVTHFFRDPAAFESLKTNALLPLLRGLDSTTSFRAWVPGCASGEEAVSIAILIYECLRELDKLAMNVRIFASDANHSLIQQARSGFYAGAAVEGMPAIHLQEHFTQEGSGYRVRNHISRMIIWSEHNLVEHPPFSRLHLISCRNVFIYFQPRLQERLHALFRFALQPQGILFLGSAEKILDENIYTPIDPAHSIYRSNVGQHHPPQQPDQPPFTQVPERSKRQARERFPSSSATDHELALVKHALLAHYGNPCALVDQAHQVRYTYGDVSPYLRLAPGTMDQQHILDMALPGLAEELMVALSQEFNVDEPVVRRGVSVEHNGQTHLLNLIVIAIADAAQTEQHRLVIFEPVASGSVANGSEGGAQHAVSSSSLPADDLPEDHQPATIARLYADLQQTRQALQHATRALRVQRATMKSSASEMRAIQEEMQAANEELRTSKEELETLNEELNTLNNQLIAQNEELMHANDTLYNFLQSTEIAMIFLDLNLAVRRYTRAATDIFHLRPIDAGRHLFEIANRLAYDALPADAHHVLQTLANIEKEVHTSDGRWYLVRIRPYRTTNNVIDGLVLTFSDITNQKTVQDALRESEAHFLAFVKASSDVVYRMSPDWREMRHLQGREFIPDTESPSRTWLETYIYPDDQPRVLHAINEAIQTKRMFQLEHRVLRVDGTPSWTVSRAVPLLDEHGEIVEWFGTASDITERKQAEEALRENEQQRVLSAAMEAERRWLAAVLHSLPLAVWITDAEGRIVETTPQANELWGGVVPHVGSINEYRTYPTFWPDTGQELTPDEYPLAQVLKTGAHLPGLTLQIACADGTRKTIVCTAAPITDAQGNMLGGVCIGQDITERTQMEATLRESEERYRMLYQAINQAYALCEIVTDVHGTAVDYRLLEVNPAFEAMTGITPEAAQGKTARQLVPTIEDWWIETYGKVALARETIRFENRVAEMNRWFEAYAAPIGEPGKGRFILIFTDISERKNGA